MHTLDEVTAAIKRLSSKDREQLIARLPDIFPEIDGDAKWEEIIRDSRPRPALEKYLDEVSAEFRQHPEKFRPTTDEEFNRHS